MFDDDYPTCARTYATLCIYPEGLDPLAITERLAIEPTSWQRQGEMQRRTDGPSRVATIDGWFLSSKGRVESRDSRRHVEWILDQVRPKAEAVRALIAEGCRIVLSCYWASASGHGGPTVPVSQMQTLGDLGAELWFDFYGPYDGA